MVCTLWVPVLNAKSFVLSRPPICIFILSLVGLGLFVKETTSILKNPDEMDWNDVQSRFNKVSFCIHPEMNPPANTSGMEYVSVPFELDDPVDKIWRNYTLISGSLSSSYLGLKDHPSSNLPFSLSLMESQKKICLTLFHPPTVSLPHPIINCNSLQNNLLPRSIGAIVIPPQDTRSRGMSSVTCPEESKVSLKLKNNPKWTILLNEEDRSLVSFRLMVTSGFIFMMLMMMVCFAAVRGDIKTKSPKPNSYNEILKESIDF